MIKHQVIAGIEKVLALKGRSVSSFLSKLFGKAKVAAAQETAVSEGCVPATQKTSERQGGTTDRTRLDARQVCPVTTFSTNLGSRWPQRVPPRVQRSKAGFE